MATMAGGVFGEHCHGFGKFSLVSKFVYGLGSFWRALLRVWLDTIYAHGLWLIKWFSRNSSLNLNLIGVGSFWILLIWLNQMVFCGGEGFSCMWVVVSIFCGGACSRHLYQCPTESQTTCCYAHSAFGP